MASAEVLLFAVRFGWLMFEAVRSFYGSDFFALGGWGGRWLMFEKVLEAFLAPILSL